jgi:hypothetical protein
LKLSVAFLSQPSRSIVAVDISVVSEPLPSYQQFLIARCHDILPTEPLNSNLLVSADMSHVPVAWQWQFPASDISAF